MKMTIVTTWDEVAENTHLVSEEVYKEIALLIMARTHPEMSSGLTPRAADWAAVCQCPEPYLHGDDKVCRVCGKPPNR